MEDKKKILQTEKRNRFFVLFQSLLVIIKDEKIIRRFFDPKWALSFVRMISQRDCVEIIRVKFLPLRIQIVPLLVIILVLRLILYFIDRLFVSLSGSILDRKKIRMAASKNIGGLGVSTCESSRSNASSLLQGQGRDELSITKLIFPCAATPTWIVIKKRYPKIIVLLFFPSSSYINSTVNIFVDDKKLSTFKEKLIKLYLEQLWRIILAIKIIK